MNIGHYSEFHVQSSAKPTKLLSTWVWNETAPYIFIRGIYIYSGDAITTFATLYPILEAGLPCKRTCTFHSESFFRVAHSDTETNVHGSINGHFAKKLNLVIGDLTHTHMHSQKSRVHYARPPAPSTINQGKKMQNPSTNIPAAVVCFNLAPPVQDFWVLLATPVSILLKKRYIYCESLSLFCVVVSLTGKWWKCIRSVCMHSNVEMDHGCNSLQICNTFDVSQNNFLRKLNTITVHCNCLDYNSVIA